MTRKEKVIAAVTAGIIFTGSNIISDLSNKLNDMQHIIEIQVETNQEKDVRINELEKKIKHTEEIVQEKNIEIHELQEENKRHIQRQQEIKQEKLQLLSYEEPTNVMHVELTFYVATGNLTASGTVPRVGHTIACNFLPLGTRVRINGNIYTVEDRGGMLGNTVDVFVDSEYEALQLGRQSAVMEIL